ncbi:MAG: RNA polymerase subunit sigma-70 [Bacteroidetes bacterium]|nr:MAG: RNA polymerase subunit sigma-70 [Bacteroidota bacterium]
MKAEFEKMILENRLLLLRICRFYYARHEKEAREDLYQEIVLNLWKSYPKFVKNPQCKPSTWLYRVALNTALLQKRNERKLLYTPLNKEVIHTEEDDSDPIIKTLYRLVEKLTEEEKHIVYLYLEDLSHQEIAAVLGISVSNVGTKIYRIKQKLKHLKEKEI